MRNLIWRAGLALMSVGERLMELSEHDIDLQRRAKWSLEQRHTKLEAEHENGVVYVRGCGRHLTLIVGGGGR